MEGTRKDTSPLAELLCFDLYAASRSVTSVYRVLLDPLGLTYPQYLVMLVLWRRGDSTVRELVEELQLDYNTLSPLLKRLEARGLVQRHRRPDDERSVAVVLTADGRAMRDQAAHVPAAIGDAMGVDEAEIAALQGVLRRITAHAGARAAALGGRGA
ncbi:MarR family winged helix-turn-helix transcriptional regulator [Streptomyces flavofungini]|uniref:MarR family transcriptional regulator n=1 Tax=Streptomyces flavofungini TaxID=68200 RepID=A0ABS0X9N8_9ACTN|nr:MarR family transcriptional regulator [Streptomyces flavofungini]MBJ3809920.1 MarR family transcriptional regulator [Streptomyces flavofungini]GHC54077.1 MarR family transcriptional regulator [Streptomyces flavofungini]